MRTGQAQAGAALLQSGEGAGQEPCGQWLVLALGLESLCAHAWGVRRYGNSGFRVTGSSLGAQQLHDDWQAVERQGCSLGWAPGHVVLLLISLLTGIVGAAALDLFPGLGV